MKTSNLVFLLTMVIFLLANCKQEELLKVSRLNTGSIDPLSITFDAATANGNFITIGSDVSDFGHCWGASANPTISDFKFKVNGTPQGPIVSYLTNLIENSTYHVRAYAIDNGTAVYGDDVTFKTLEYGMPVLSTTEITAITHNSASSGGNVSSDGGSPVTAKGVCWSTQENPTVALTTKTNNGTGTGVFSSTITGLTPNTPYYVRAYATNSKGTSYGDQKNLTTAQAPYIHVTSPDITDHWVGSISYDIIWEDNIPENVYIELYKDGNQVGSDIVTAPGIGINSYNWNVPDNIGYAKNYIIRVTSITSPSVFGESQPFTISEPSGSTGNVSDNQGNVYNTIKIGKQWWMSQDLRSSYYSDGTQLVNGATAVDITGDTTTRYYFAYNNDNGNVSTYGRLYTWAAAMKGAAASNSNPSGVPGICPAGWHLPSDVEWKEIESAVGLQPPPLDQLGYRGTIQGGQLKETGTAHWASTNTDVNNASGFTALPTGYRHYQGYFEGLTNYTYYWTTTRNGLMAYFRGLYANVNTIYRHNNANCSYGLAVRCVKD